MYPKIRDAMRILGYIFDTVVSGYVYIIILVLVVYMLSTLVDGVQFIGYTLSQLGAGPVNTSGALGPQTTNVNLLHTIAYTIVLVKAYKILMSYAETHHINLKFLVEIAIIAPTVELLFNSEIYTFGTNILFAGFAFGNLLLYLFFYETLRRVSRNYEVEAGSPEVEVR